MVVVAERNNHAIKVYSNREKFFSLSHNLPNQIRINKNYGYFQQ